MILDTCFVVDLLNNDTAAVKKAQELDRLHMPLFTTAITVFEIWQGVSDIKDKNKLEKINTLLESIGLLQLDQESAKIGGVVHSGLYRQGVPIQPEDSMIAGIALTHGKKILTRNIKHFSRIKNVVVERY